MSPAEYARGLRNQRARAALKANGRVTDAIYDAGYSGPERLLQRCEREARNDPIGMARRRTRRDDPLDDVRQPARDDADRGDLKGICRLTFDDSEASLKRLFPNATIVKDDGGLRELVEGALTAIERPLAAPDLPIDVAGTAFQEAVWRELRKIPLGETRSYADIAAAIGAPKAVRAVGSANGDNHVCVLIPCHRVIRSDGTLGGYGGGIERKRKLLAAEGHPAAAPELPLVD